MDVHELIEGLNSPSEADRMQAAENLDGACDSRTVAALASRLSVESSRAVMEAIFRSLGRIRGNEVLRTMIDFIGSDDAFIRNEAVRVLGTFGSMAIPALVCAAGSKNCDVRKFALDAIATIDSGRKEDIYRSFLDDADINLVATAVEYIGRDGIASLRERVEAVLKTANHPMLVAVCVETLGQIGNADSLETIFRKLRCEGMLEFHTPGFVRAIGQVGTHAHLDLLCRLIAQLPAAMIESGFDAIEAIGRRVPLLVAPAELFVTVAGAIAENPDPLMRYRGARTLGAFTDDKSRSLLRQYLESSDKMVRLAAVETIAHWEPSEAKDLLSRRQSVETDEDVLDAIQDSVNQLMRNAA